MIRNHANDRYRFHRVGLVLGLLFSQWAFVSQSAVGAMVSLSDLNSSAVFETQSQAGLKDWLIDGVDQLTQQWFWYRLGNSGPERSLDTLLHNPLTDAILSDTNANPGDDHLRLKYTDTAGRFAITLDYQLTGATPGSGHAGLDYSITIQSLRHTGSLSFNFFQYSNFDLLGDAMDDSVAIMAPGAIMQTDGSTPSGAQFAPGPNRVEVNTVSGTLAALNDGSPTNLNNNVGPLVNNDLTWALQWRFVLPAGSSYVIGQSHPVPEPSTACLAGLALAVLAGLGLRRRVH